MHVPIRSIIENPTVVPNNNHIKNLNLLFGKKRQLSFSPHFGYVFDCWEEIRREGKKKATYFINAKFSQIPWPTKAKFKELPDFEV